MTSGSVRYRIHRDLAWRAIDEHVFAITPDGRQHELAGDVERLVWQALESGPCSRDALLAAVLEGFDAEPTGPERVGSDLDVFLGDLLLAKVVEMIE